MSEKEKKGTDLTFNEAGLIVYMFPPQWQGTDKQLDVLNQFMNEIEDAVDKSKTIITEFKNSFDGKEINEDEFTDRAKREGEKIVYTLTSNQGVNLIKQEWPSRKFPRLFAKHVISLRDKLGLY